MNKIINQCMALIASYTGNKEELRAALLKEMLKAPYYQRAYIFIEVQKALQKAKIIL